jgi:hypothetical protein
VTVRVSFHPDVVARLAAQGITAQRTTEDAPPSASRSTSGGGFVLARGPGPRAQGAVTHVVSVRGHVVVTGQQTPQAVRRHALSAAPAIAAPVNAERDSGRTSSALIAECDRLRRENQRLSGEGAECDRLRRENQRLSGDVARLRAEVARLSRVEEPRGREPVDLDDAATRFSLLELDL